MYNEEDLNKQRPILRDLLTPGLGIVSSRFVETELIKFETIVDEVKQDENNNEND